MRSRSFSQYEHLAASCVVSPKSKMHVPHAAADATEATDPQKRKADGSADGSGPPRRTKKGKKGRRGGNSSASGSAAAEVAPQDLVAVSPLPPNSEMLQVNSSWRIIEVARL